MSGFRAILAGATGMVGGECLKRLLASERYSQVVVVTRRKVNVPGRNPKLRQAVVEFDRLGDVRDRLHGDHVFCALGTTIRKAGSRGRFREVDLEYPLRFAQLTRKLGATHFSIVSALGARRTSPFFYSRVKGEVEQGLQQMGWPSLGIFRPSIIAGERAESRPLEWVSEQVLRFAPATWRPVSAVDIGAAMVSVALRSSLGVTIVESRDIPAVAAGRSVER